jgi:hypothetical protein
MAVILDSIQHSAFHSFIITIPAVAAPFNNHGKKEVPSIAFLKQKTKF